MTQARRTLILVLLFAALAPLIYLHCQPWIAKPFWDSHSYGKAITGYSHGGSMFVTPGYTQYLYPPIFAVTGAGLAKVLTPALGWKLFLGVHMACLLAIPFLLARFYLRGMGYLEAFLLFALAPMCLTEQIFLGGNVASICYFAALLAAVPGLLSKRWLWFYIVTVLASSIKITFLLFLLLPILLESEQIVPSLVTVAATGGVYLAQRILVPGLYREWRGVLVQHTLEDRNFGFAPYGTTANILNLVHVTGQAIPAAVEIVFGLAVLAALWHLRSRVPPGDSRWLALIVLSIILLNPRMVDYDAVVALLPAYYLLLPNWRRPSTLVFLLLSGAAFFVRHGVVGFLLLFLFAFWVGYRELRAGPVAEPAALASQPA